MYLNSFQSAVSATLITNYQKVSSTLGCLCEWSVSFLTTCTWNISANVVYFRYQKESGRERNIILEPVFTKAKCMSSNWLVIFQQTHNQEAEIVSRT